MATNRSRYASLAAKNDVVSPDKETMEFLRLIVDEGTLGASKHVDLIHRLFLHVMQRKADQTVAWREVDLLAGFIIDVRGRDTPIIRNSITWILQGMNDIAADRRQQELIRRRALWQERADHRRAAVKAVGANTLKDCSTLLLFDYSSTVEAIVEATVNQHVRPHVVVLESRAIAGGRPYLAGLAKLGLSVQYLPDVAVEYAMKHVDAVLLGAESVRADGSLLNTIGSRMVARVARAHQADVFGCTDLFKYDAPSSSGVLKTPSLRDYTHVLLADEALAQESLKSQAPELEVVSADFLTGYITEAGAVLPAHIRSLGHEALTDIGGEFQ